MARREEWSSPSIVIAMVALLVGVIPKIVPYFQRPGVVYYLQDLATYLITNRGNKLAPADVQGKMLVNGPIKILRVMVQNKGDRSADVLVKIPWLAADGYLGGWMTKSQAPSKVYMLSGQTEYPFHKLFPGDAITFYLYLRNASSDLDNRIQVFNGDGRRAEFYPYVPVRYVGKDEVIIPLRKLWIYIFVILLIGILLVSVSRIRKPKQALAIAAEGQGRADGTDQPSTTAEDLMSQDCPPSRRTTKGR